MFFNKAAPPPNPSKRKGNFSENEYRKDILLNSDKKYFIKFRSKKSNDAREFKLKYIIGLSAQRRGLDNNLIRLKKI
jgi:hypothetical protein